MLTVTLNPALDITYRVDAIKPGTTHRIDAMDARAGGKGINVARVLTQLGEQVTAAGLLGGPTGDAVRADLAKTNIVDRFAPIAADSRRTVTVVETTAVRATIFIEDGPEVTAGEWQAFLDLVDRLDPADCIVVSGSMPPSLPKHAMSELLGRLSRFRLPIIVDTSGPALLDAAEAGVDILKPNRDELADATGCADVVAGANRLRGLGARAVVVSLGHEGLIALTPSGDWRAVLQHPVEGNATGAGDAVVASLARGIARGTSWPERALDAVALSAAAVAHPLAGSVDGAAYETFLGQITMGKLT